jgi:ribosomal protein S18 acetylase RimI-like enzyme
MAISVTILSRRHCLDIVRLHRSGIKTGFLSTTGDIFLRTLYSAINRSPCSRVYMALDDNSAKPVGFIAGALSTSVMYRHIIVWYGLLFFILLFPNIFRISVLIKILETLFYTEKKQRCRGADQKIRADRGKSNTSHGRAELLSIVVDENFRGQKIGKKLVDSLERYFTENGVHDYKVVTYSKDANANAFYQACGFIKRAEFIHHGNVMFEYSKTLEAIAQP